MLSTEGPTVKGLVSHELSDHVIGAGSTQVRLTLFGTTASLTLQLYPVMTLSRTMPNVKSQ